MRRVWIILAVLVTLAIIGEVILGLRRPSYIIANGHTFPIFYSHTYPDKLQDIGTEGEGHVYGATTCEPVYYIQVDPDQSDEEMRDTLWHEAHHAENDCSELDATTYDQLYQEQIAEELHLMQENPLLMRYLTRSSWLK